MESDLLHEFDELIVRRGHENRSEALRDLVRKELTADSWDRGGTSVATITLVFDHHVRELTERLTEIQHDHSTNIISTLHVHLDHDRCLEVIVARGPAQTIKAMADRLMGARGVLTGSITPAALAAQGGRRKRTHEHRERS
ncbi:MAG: nickel-responsive transcriptional regulator NikR [Polyangiaceae bacterium]|nr:nickel-responsive transcriptional regulator NikR [Polyangiaceae bacterium]